MYQYFKGNYASIQEVKNEYRKLAFKYHPDKGGSTEIMQKINSEYDKIIREVNSKQDKPSNINEYYENNFKKIIEKLIKLEDVKIYIVGWYIWIEGENTKKYKDYLKEIGCLWSSGQKKWFYNGDTRKYKKSSKKEWSEIVTKYGCERVTTENKSYVKLQEAI